MISFLRKRKEEMKSGIEIQGGEKRGFKLKAPRGIRPTQSLVKRSLFDRLGPWIVNRRMLELYAGSGAVGFEALSRGASEVVFVDRSRSAVLSIMENAEKLGYRERVKAVRREALKFLRELRERGDKFDFVFADPPYDVQLSPEFFDLVGEILEKEGLFVLELRWKDREIKGVSGLELEKEVKLGDTALLFFGRVSG
ncbi:MAG: 16S rRNA (guanine(966)-N(2))-methyltransferase RsmD [Candidatus Hydrothermota bacterium]|nr:MAG: 16S rRNA (guanine(966)-N(2))-methyltransferase RsmD [Candidatus Hydrothermae bacterium]